MGKLDHTDLIKINTNPLILKSVRALHESGKIHYIQLFKLFALNNFTCPGHTTSTVLHKKVKTWHPRQEIGNVISLRIFWKCDQSARYIRSPTKTHDWKQIGVLFGLRKVNEWYLNISLLLGKLDLNFTSPDSSRKLLFNSYFGKWWWISSQ